MARRLFGQHVERHGTDRLRALYASGVMYPVSRKSEYWLCWFATKASAESG